MTPLPAPLLQPCPDADPQCGWLLARIGELQQELSLQADASLARPWMLQLHRLMRRVRERGCLDCKRHGREGAAAACDTGGAR